MVKKQVAQFTVPDGQLIAAVTGRLAGQVLPNGPNTKQFGGLRRPKSGSGGGLSCHFTLSAVLNATDATGTAVVHSCPERPSLEGQTVTLTNTPQDNPATGYIFFGEVGIGGVGAYNAADETVWIQNLACDPAPYSNPQSVSGTTNPAEPYGFYFG